MTCRSVRCNDVHRLLVYLVGFPAPLLVALGGVRSLPHPSATTCSSFSRRWPGRRPASVRISQVGIGINRLAEALAVIAEMPRCYMVKKQCNKYQASAREFWEESGVASASSAPESPTEACVAPSIYTSLNNTNSKLNDLRF